MSIIKSWIMELARIVEADYVTVPVDEPASMRPLRTSKANSSSRRCCSTETQMREAAKKFEFEKAAQLRDRIRSLSKKMWPDYFNGSNSRAGGASKLNNTALRSSSGRRCQPNDAALLERDDGRTRACN